MPLDTATDLDALPDFEEAFLNLDDAGRDFLLSLNRRLAGERSHVTSWEKDWDNSWKQWIK